MNAVSPESVKIAAQEAVFRMYGLEKEAFSFRDTLRGLSDKAKSFGSLFSRPPQAAINTAPTVRPLGLPPLTDVLGVARNHPTLPVTPQQMLRVPGAASPQARTLSLAPEAAPARTATPQNLTLPVTPAEMAHVPGATGRNARTLNLESGTFSQPAARAQDQVSTPHVPRASEREAGSESFGGKKYTGMGLGGALAISPEGAFLQQDPKFRKMYQNAVRGGQGMEELDALAHQLMQHQASGGQINPMRARQIMQTPSYARTLQAMKTGSIRPTSYYFNR